MGFCNFSPQPSAVAGNIGIVKAKVMVWDHDPFWGRATQNSSWLFSGETAKQMRETVPEAHFEAGAAILRPIFRHHDMFICTQNAARAEANGGGAGPGFINPVNPNATTSVDPSVDFVGSVDSGVGAIAGDRLPGGKIYECNGGLNSDNPGPCFVDVNGESVRTKDPTTGKDIFPHQVWKHIGNMFDSTVLIHPSEYNGVSLSQLQSARATNANGRIYSFAEIQSAAKWDYIQVADSGKISIWPAMYVKQLPNQENPVHWTLEKWTPIWQGQDFFVTIRLGEKEPDDTVDPGGDIIGTKIDQYKYLMYDLAPGNYPQSDNSPNSPQSSPTWIKGISNQAFWIPPKNDSRTGQPTATTVSDALKASRERYDWRYKTYILIELGINDPLHNYFIELVKGRNPRLLHLGEEWDNPNRLDIGSSNAQNDTGNEQNDDESGGFRFVRKCREIAVFENLSCNELFKKKNFRVTVRSHLGRLIITFEGYEDQPWIVQRKDNDPRSVKFDKVLIPMVVPSGLVRLHGGNISCAINYTPLQYVPTATVPFYGRQADTFGAVNEDLYMTFSHMGASLKYFNPTVKERFFNDERFRYDKIGYDCDSYYTMEQLRNGKTVIPVYEHYDEQYRKYGKGWIYDRPRTEREWEVERDPDTLLPVPPRLVNAMSPVQKGTPSTLSIVNLLSPNRPFAFGLYEATDFSYPYKDYASKWDVGVQLKAGSVRINLPAGRNSSPVLSTGVRAKLFENYVTPIATSWRMTVLGGGKPIQGNVTPFDISKLVSSINDSWSAEDFTTINHTMDMQCYIPIEATVSESLTPNTDPEQENLYALGRKLIALHDKSFYITASYWWDVGIGKREVEGNTLNSPSIDPSNNKLLIQMTGVAKGAKLERSNNRLLMSFTVKDYMTVLNDQKIFNSPFFDGVQDVQAIYELGKMAGFDDSNDLSTSINRKPLGYLKKVLDDGFFIGDDRFFYNGEESRCERFDLKGSYADLSEPAVKFQNGETFESAVKKIAEQSGKAIYFDRWGVLRFETLPAMSAAFASAQEISNYRSVFDFVTTPIPRTSNIPSPGGDGNTEDFVFDSSQHAAHLVYNAISYQRGVEDCINQIVLLTASNDIKLPNGETTGGFAIEGYTFFDQIWDPRSEGFIGYRKAFFQSEGGIGGIEGLRNGIMQYARMKHPPINVTFETYSVPGLKALDIVSLDNTKLYIREISHEIDPSTNRAWMNITGEWLKPNEDPLGFLQVTQPTTGGDPSQIPEEMGVP